MWPAVVDVERQLSAAKSDGNSYFRLLAGQELFVPLHRADADALLDTDHHAVSPDKILKIYGQQHFPIFTRGALPDLGEDTVFLGGPLAWILKTTGLSEQIIINHGDASEVSVRAADIQLWFDKNRSNLPERKYHNIVDTTSYGQFTGPLAHALACGAHLPVSNAVPWNVLSRVHYDYLAVTSGIRKGWGIYNASDWRQAIDQLLDRKSGVTAGNLVLLIRLNYAERQHVHPASIDALTWWNVITEWGLQNNSSPEEIKQLHDTVGLVVRYEERFKADGLLGQNDFVTTAFAWDLGRAVNMAKWGLTTGYCDYLTAELMTLEAGSVAREYYQSWSEFSAGYIMGRVLHFDEGTFGEWYQSVLEVHRILLNDPASPWLNIDFAPTPLTTDLEQETSREIVDVDVTTLPERLRGPVEIADPDILLSFMQKMQAWTGRFAIPLFAEEALDQVDDEQLMITDRQEILLHEAGATAAWPMITTPADLATLITSKDWELFRVSDDVPGLFWLSTFETAMLLRTQLADAFHQSPDNPARPVEPELQIALPLPEVNDRTQAVLDRVGVSAGKLTEFAADVQAEGLQYRPNTPFDVYVWTNGSDGVNFAVTPLGMIVDATKPADFDGPHLMGGVMETETMCRILVGSATGSWFTVVADRADRVGYLRYQCAQGDTIPMGKIGFCFTPFADLVLYPDVETLELAALPHEPPSKPWPHHNPFAVEDGQYVYAVGELTYIQLNGNMLTGETYWLAHLQLTGSGVVTVMLSNKDLASMGCSRLRKGMIIAGSWRVSVSISAYDEGDYDQHKGRQAYSRLLEDGIIAKHLPR